MWTRQSVLIQKNEMSNPDLGCLHGNSLDFISQIFSLVKIFANHTNVNPLLTCYNRDCDGGGRSSHSSELHSLLQRELFLRRPSPEVLPTVSGMESVPCQCLLVTGLWNPLVGTHRLRCWYSSPCGLLPKEDKSVSKDITRIRMAEQLQDYGTIGQYYVHPIAWH